MLFVSVSLYQPLSLWRSCGWRRWARPVSFTFRRRNKQPKKCSCERCVSFPTGTLPIFTHCTKCALPASQSSLKCAGPALLRSGGERYTVLWIETIARGFLLSLSVELLGFIRRFLREDGVDASWGVRRYFYYCFFILLLLKCYFQLLFYSMSECTVIESTIIFHARKPQKTMDRRGKECKERSDVQGEVSKEIVWLQECRETAEGIEWQNKWRIGELEKISPDLEKQDT